MKVDDFLSKQVPGQMTVDEVIAEEPEHVTSLTPSGIECWYSWAPRRHYKLRYAPFTWPGGTSILGEWREVPSVTTVLDVLNKPALPWWGMRVGVEGVLALNRKHVLVAADFDREAWDEPDAWDVDSIVQALTQHKLTVNHQKDSAAKRGVNVHSAFEKWADDQSFRPIVETYPENEQGYIRGLIAFLDDLGVVEDVESEVMVGSIVHGFGGRYDVRLTLPEPREMVTRIYPKREPKREMVPAGRWLGDVKTSKSCYPSHSIQLAAYELASVECGYGTSDHRAVIHLTADGQYELRVAHASADDFLSVLRTHQTMQRKGWFS